MKNLKKVLALVVALTMVLGTVSFAFTDVAEESDVYTAVQTLSSLGILNGYEDGTFGPEKDITRAEFATVVCRALNVKSAATGATQFADVPADHWASGYINYVAGLGIVNGYGDGNFGPEDNVTYEQAIKMLVVALGFEPMAAQKGGYPTGYLVVANTYGMTEDVKAPADAAAANRGVVAHLTYNALDIPMMGQTGFGTNVEYKILDGAVGSGTKYTTLLTGLDVVKLGGVVTGTKIHNNAAAGEIAYKITENFDNAAWTEGSTVPLTIGEGINADDYFQMASEIFAKEVKSGKWEVIAIMPGADSAPLTIDKGDIEGTVTSDGLEYYAAKTATKTTKIYLDNPDVYYNNDTSSLVALNNTGAGAWSDDAIVTLVENTGDSKYDAIIVKEYDPYVVKKVEAEKDRFSVIGETGNFVLDFEDPDVVNTIVNKDGEAITLADFAEGDVLEIISENGKRNNKWIEIINLGQNAVTGTVTEKGADGTSIYVDGVEYDLAGTTANVGDEGMFYLTKTGKIFKVDANAAVSANYGYVLEMAINKGGFSNAWQIKLLTKEGKVETFDVKDTFKIADSDGIDKAVASSGLGFLQAIAQPNVGTAFKTNVANRLVTYRLDSNNKIREIDQVNITKNFVDTDKQYKGSTQSLNDAILDDDAVIFNVAGNSLDDAFVTGVASLVDETMYKGAIVYNTNQEVHDCVVIVDGLGAIDWAQDIAIVESVSDIEVNDDPAKKVRYYVAGDETVKEITVISGETSFETGVIGDLAKGTLFMFTDDGDGVAENCAIIATANTSVAHNSVPYTVNSAAQAEINGEDDLKLVWGYIDSVNDKGTVLTAGGYDVSTGSDGSKTMVAINDSMNAYTYVNKTSTKISIEVGDWMAADVDAADGNTVYFFIAKTENSVVTDIVTFATAKDISSVLSGTIKQ